MKSNFKSLVLLFLIVIIVSYGILYLFKINNLLIISLGSGIGATISYLIFTYYYKKNIMT